MEITQTMATRKPERLAVIWRRLRRYPATLMGFAIVGLFLLLAVIGLRLRPTATPIRYLADRLQPPSSRSTVFGTDQFGRDIFSRILVGSRDVFVVAGSGAAGGRAARADAGPALWLLWRAVG